MLTLLIIIAFGVAIYYAINGVKEHFTPTNNSLSSTTTISNITITPRPISKFQQINYLAPDINVLTFFRYQNGILELRFKDGTSFNKALSDCSFQLGRDKYNNRTVSPKGSPFSWTVYEIGSILTKDEWNTVFSILSNAGTVYGKYQRLF